jgi:hypothetical protein
MRRFIEEISILFGAIQGNLDRDCFSCLDLLRQRSWQKQKEIGSPAGRGHAADAAVMRLGNGFADAQAQARTLVGAVRGTVELAETPE